MVFFVEFYAWEFQTKACTKSIIHSIFHSILCTDLQIFEEFYFSDCKSVLFCKYTCESVTFYCDTKLNFIAWPKINRYMLCEFLLKFDLQNACTRNFIDAVKRI